MTQENNTGEGMTREDLHEYMEDDRSNHAKGMKHNGFVFMGTVVKRSDATIVVDCYMMTTGQRMGELSVSGYQRDREGKIYSHWSEPGDLKSARKWFCCHNDDWVCIKDWRETTGGVA